MAYFNFTTLKSTTIEDGIIELMYYLIQYEKDYLEQLRINDPTADSTPKFSLNIDDNSKVITFAGSLRAIDSLNTQGKIQYDPIEYLPVYGVGSAYG